MAVRTADVIIFGAEEMGHAAAYQLAKDGRSVLALEQFAIGNRQGSSHGASRLFRLAHEKAYSVELAHAAHLLWGELESDSSQQLMYPVEALDLGTPGALEGFSTTLASTPLDQAAE